MKQTQAEDGQNPKGSKTLALVRDQRGASLIEYGLLLVLLVVASVAALNGLSKNVNAAMGQAANALAGDAGVGQPNTATPQKR